MRKFLFEEGDKKYLFSFDPVHAGWEYATKTSCCLYFNREEYILRINLTSDKESGYVVVYYGESTSIPIMKPARPFKSHLSFENAVNNAINKHRRSSIVANLNKN